MTQKHTTQKPFLIFVSYLVLSFYLIVFSDVSAADLVINQASWNADNLRLRVSGTAGSNENVDIFNADTGELIGQTQAVASGNWRLDAQYSSSVGIPCRVRASTSSADDERDVTNAPDCGGGVIGPPPSPMEGDYSIVAANDLGMHCADLDYQIFSILPPFNVVHAQVILKGTQSSPPQILDNTVVDVLYSASSSPTDPAGGNSINTTSQNLPGIFKTNFWQQLTANSTRGGTTYGSLYPSVLAVDPGNLCQLTFTCPSALSLFDPLPQNLGIPVPDPKALYPVAGMSSLVIDQQAMPGLANIPQHFDRFDDDLPFFVNFPFGSRIEGVNWFAADGIPILPIDDTGRANAYPLMKIAAHSIQGGGELASVDVVLPVASEADCQNCHVQPIDCADPGLPPEMISDQCNGSAVSQTVFDVITLDDDPPGLTRLEQLLNTAKINILRLHDTKHGAAYQNWDNTGQLASKPCDANNAADLNCLINQTPVQCSRCHYSPALDLAQVGPINEPEQGVKGRQQTIHISMSSAMHGHHGNLPLFEGQPLFPEMPAPIDRSPTLAQQILTETCYQCHPGKRTQCLRGAMATGGVVCQDCHGSMAQVGDDFSVNFPNVAFPQGADLSKRVPWASEPGCQSCHTGDALSNLAGTVGTIAADPHGIRLRQAYLQGDTNAAPLIAVNKRFAESESLFRLSKGHGGVICEGCHGSTHAIWPISNSFANDNLAAQQLQGHSGTIIECNTCHTEGSLGLTLDGPHGMHPVGDANWNTNHAGFTERNPDSCRACHGPNGEGAVLARMAMTRTLRCKSGSTCNNELTTLAKGTEVGCGTCHQNALP